MKLIVEWLYDHNFEKIASYLCAVFSEHARKNAKAANELFGLCEHEAILVTTKYVKVDDNTPIGTPVKFVCAKCNEDMPAALFKEKK